MNPTLPFCRPAVAVTTAAALSGSALAAAGADEKTTYDDHVRPLFESKCFSCHNPDKTKGGLDLTTYGSTMAGGSSGEVANPGDPGGSLLLALISHAEEPVMPPKGDRLGDGAIDTVSRWLEGGLLETMGSKAKAPKKSGFEMAVDPDAAGKPDGPPPMPAPHLPLDPYVATASGTVVNDLATSPWAQVIAATGQKQVLLYDAASLDLLGVLAYPEGFPQSLSFSRNGKLVVAGGGRHGKSGNLVAWDITTGERVLELGAEFDAVFAADLNPAQTRAALGSSGKKVKLLDTATGETVKTIEKHTEWITALAFSPDGRYLATADRNGGVLVWEAETGNEIHTLEGHRSGVTDLAWRPDSNVLATSSDTDGQVRLWDLKSGNKIKEWTAHGGGTLSVQFSAAGSLVTAGRDGRAKLWQGDGKHTRDLEPPGDRDLVSRASFNHDGTVAYAADWHGRIMAFDVSEGAVLASAATNPPALADRIAQLAGNADAREAEAAAARTAADQAAAEIDALAATLAKLEQELADQRTALDAARQNQETKATAAAQARAAAEAAQAELDRWRNRAAAHENDQSADVATASARKN